MSENQESNSGCPSDEPSENQESNSGCPSDEPNYPSQLIPTTALPDNDGANTNAPNAVCQPNNLTDLLKLSTSLQSNSPTEQSSPQTDPARAEYLKNALASLTVDVVQDMRTKLLTLQKVTSEPYSKSTKPPPHEEVFDEIFDRVENIDLAIAFYQIGGLKVMSNLLHHSEAGIRELAAYTIAICCRNNPYCQSESMEEPVFSSLIKMAENDSNKPLMFQAISAISAIVRDNPRGIEVLQKDNGLAFLNKAMDSANEKIVIKTSYLIKALCDTDSNIKDDLVNMGIVEKLISLVKLTGQLTVLHFLLALDSLTHNHSSALRQCLYKQFMFYSSLEYHVRKCRAEDSYQGICEVATRLQKRLRKEAENIFFAAEVPTNIEMYDLTILKK